MTTINDPLLGTTYDGRYRIERRIGVGGMANVYLAEDMTLGRQVAIKVLHQRYAEDSQFVERFLREASAAAKLNHPNIVQVYDRGKADHSYYIAMEYIDGMTLKDLVQRRGGLTEQEVLAYARQALHALRFAHRNGIVHRDIKPHNMMVDTDGRLKIADFGIARAGADSGLTEAGSIVGTAQYLSPEQAQGHDVGAPSDLYSLGVVMFEMATGRVPFDGESPVNVALKHVKDPAPRPSQITPGISVALESIILKAMEKDPSLRYGTADEMLEDLDLAREGAQTRAMTQVIAPAAAVAAATQIYEQPLPPEPAWADTGWVDPDAQDEEEEPRSKWRWLAPLLVVLALAAVAGGFFLFGSEATGDPVPDVVGQSLSAARATIVENGFIVGEVTKEFSEEPEGRVLDQDPGGGDKLEAGQAIDLVVSNGPELTEVPDVVGLAMNPAINALTGAGFKVVQAPRESSDTVKAGFVIRQTPSGGDEIEPGASVTIVLSSGPEASSLPSVVGMDVAEAQRTLEAADFVVTIQEVDSSQPQGTVVSQSPTANTEVEAGARVTLRVASGSNVVPDVAGLSENEAVRAIEEAGFRTTVTREATTDTTQVGVVLRTDPAGDQRSEVGTTVTVTIGEQDTSTTPAPVP